MEQYCVRPGTNVVLTEWDSDDRGDFAKKSAGKAEVNKLNKQLESLQELLYAEGKHKLLIVLQGRDTAGKDSTIRHVFDGVNPQGVQVSAFKAPTPEELSHDYLWRIHQHTPARGQIVIFNRSHYEDVLVVRVHELVPQAVWRRRYDHINNFERMLSDEGVTVLKFYLHISTDEQKERLQERLDNPSKHWKFQPRDLDERALWPAYTAAYQEMLSRTSTAWAPWYIVPANRKWYRNWVISTVLVETLKGLQMAYPPAAVDVSKFVIE